MKSLVPILLVFLIGISFAQESARLLEVGILRFQGNEQLKAEQLQDVIQTRETPWAFWKFIYRNISESIGKKPEYYDPVIFESDYHQVKRVYENKGFYHARIDTVFQINWQKRTIDVLFKIDEGIRSLIDTISYKGIEDISTALKFDIRANAIVKSGDPYDLMNIESELRRIIILFDNSGYIHVKIDTVFAKRYASTNNFSVVYAFTPGARYKFGRISIEYDSTSTGRVDTTTILQHLDFREGEYYNEERRAESERNLNRLGVFDISKIDYITTSSNLGNDQVPIRVLVRTRSFQELSPEIGINDENNAFNVSLGLSYNHRNFFGGARNFSMRLITNIQSIQTNNVTQLFQQSGLRDSSLIAKVELSTQIIQPYFFNNKTSLSTTLSGIIDKQKSYYLHIVRLKTGIVTQTATYTKAFIDWDIELSNPKTVATQSDTTIKISSSTIYIKQLNSILTLTLQRDKRNDIFYPSEGFIQSISFEESGLIPHYLGKPLEIDLPYSQYIKVTLLGQWYWDPTNKRSVIWATKWKIGTAYLYGHSPTDVPLTQRFFSGGSGSVRGWQARELGIVQANQKTDQGGDAFIEGSLEARWNPLQNASSFLFLDLSKISFVFFYDVGNMWWRPTVMRTTEVAMATGFGFRYNTIAGPIRIDFGMKVYDPSASIGQQWITDKRFFPETFATGIIHFGVGHSF